MKGSQFLGWLLIVLGVAVLGGMFFDFGNFGKWWMAIDVFVAMFWIVSGIAFLRLS